MGNIFKVDLEYPEELQKLHDDYPLAPEKLAIRYDMLSNFNKKDCRQIWNKCWWC